MESQCEIMWDNKAWEYLGRQPTSYYGKEADVPENQAIISQQHLMSKILFLCIENLLTTDAKRKSRDFNTAYTYNKQDDGDIFCFFIVNIVRPDTRAGWSEIKKKLKTMRISQLKHNITKSNLHNAEWMNKIFIYGETYSGILRQ